MPSTFAIASTYKACKRTSPLTAPGLMPLSLGTCLPEETINAILVQLHDGGAWDPPPKHGLASCGLVCRHWAQTIRPMLFQRIALRSASDVDELFALLAAPPLFGRTLRQCIHALHIVEDCATLPRTSWSHRPLLRLRPPVEVNWTLDGATALAGGCASPLPFLSLPRGLPMKTARVSQVTISGVHLSTRHLWKLLCQLPLERLHLKDIIFNDETPDLSITQQSWNRRTSELHSVQMTRCITRATNLTLWLELVCFLFAKCGRQPMDHSFQTSLTSFFNLCAALHEWNFAENMPMLSVHAVWRDIDDETDGSTTFLGYRYVLENVASMHIWTNDWYNKPPHISLATFTCPDVDIAAVDALLGKLLSAITTMADGSTYPLTVRCISMESCRRLLGGVLEGRVLARVPTLLTRLIYIGVPLEAEYALQEIMSAPSFIGEDDGRIILTTEQRVEWVLKKSRDANGKRVNRRDEYLQELQNVVQRAGRSIPEEIIRIILGKLCNGYLGDCSEPKRGLASCSQTCRYWARLSRPVLFFCITLRSADDVGSLLEFLDAHDFLGCSIKDCLKFLHIEEDRTVSIVPWGHQVMLRLSHKVEALDISWKFKGASILPKQLLSLKHGRASLPISILPRTLPSPSSPPLERLILCNVQLPTVDVMAAMMRRTLIRDITFDNVTLPAGYTASELSLQPLHRRYGIPICVTVRSSIEDIARLPSWIRLCDLFCTSREYPLVDTEFEALAAQYLERLVSLHSAQKKITQLTLDYFTAGRCQEPERHFQYTLCDGPVEEPLRIAELQIERDTPQSIPPRFTDVVWRCPSTDDTQAFALVQQFEATVVEMASPTIPRTVLEGVDREFARAFVRGILEGNILGTFAAWPSLVTVDIATGGDTNLRMTLEEILAAPTHCGGADEGDPLTLEQRTEWVLCGGLALKHAHLQKLNLRSSYIQDVSTASHTSGESTKNHDVEEDLETEA
ncbi:hypothetical protein PsYK624_118110 [Phanerochaete sordida]|uniref:F-box domain-containing protein n=1 Tax=Phanerochaete sordida TaxID=48140 RepID=A0A9P3GLC1_9APHY|nr:hypothetical protein PsYK624_118110 [Phanerochaete sordida]